MGLTRAEFGKQRIWDFAVKVQEYYKALNEKLEFEATLTRLQTTALINVQLERDDRILPCELWEFPWDEKQLPEHSEEEIFEHNRKMIQAAKALPDI